MHSVRFAPLPRVEPWATAMLMSLVSFIPPPSGRARVTAATVTAATVTDLLWPHATPVDGVQHFYARPYADRIEVAVFTLARNQAVADITAYVVCLRALHQIPALRDWRLAPLSR